MGSRTFIILLAGLGGGLLRGIVGITKSKALEKGKFNLTYLAVTLGKIMVKFHQRSKYLLNMYLKEGGEQKIWISKRPK